MYDLSAKVVKFIGSDADTSVYHITAVDRGLLELKTAVSRLEAQIEDIQARIKE